MSNLSTVFITHTKTIWELKEKGIQFIRDAPQIVTGMPTHDDSYSKWVSLGKPIYSEKKLGSTPLKWTIHFL